jgi:hypothetical protein
MRKNAWTETGMAGSFYFEHMQDHLLRQRLKQEKDQHADIGPFDTPPVCPKRSARLDQEIKKLKWLP